MCDEPCGPYFDFIRPELWEEDLQGFERDHPFEWEKINESILSGDGFKYPFVSQEEVNQSENWVPEEAAPSVSDKMIDMIKKGAVIGPFTPGNEPIEPKAICALGAVPKPPAEDGTPRWRPICDGSKLNDHFDADFKRVQYAMSILVICQICVAIGANGWIWKQDLSDCFLRLPAARSAWPWQCVKWLGMTFIFVVCMFGLAVSPRICEIVMDALDWAVVNKCPGLFEKLGVRKLVHYLDDAFGGHADKMLANIQFDMRETEIERLGAVLNQKKSVRPAKELELLGWDVSLIKGGMSLTNEKRKKYKKAVRELMRSRTHTVREVQQILGKLQFAAQIEKRLKPALRRMVRLIYPKNSEGKTIELKSSHQVTFCAHTMKDLAILDNLLLTAPLSRKFTTVVRDKSEFDVRFTSDASGTIGLGGWSSNGQWYAMTWKQVETVTGMDFTDDIADQELFALCMQVLVFDVPSNEKKIRFRCDNQVVEHWIRRSAPERYRNRAINMCLLLAKCSHKHNFVYDVRYIDTKSNIIADVLSRGENVKVKLSKKQRKKLKSQVTAKALRKAAKVIVSWIKTPKTEFD